MGEFVSRAVSHASESVAAGHPDKLCDQIAGAILDEAITASTAVGLRPRVAMEVAAKGGRNGGTLALLGEVTLPAGILVDYEQVARRTVAEIGYTDPKLGFHAGLEELIINVTEQSEDIKRGVDQEETGAGDQGIIFGSAYDETPELMPMPIMMAHALMNRYTELYKGGFDFLRPDAKSLVALNYANGYPVSINKIIIAASHSPEIKLVDLRDVIFKELIVPVAAGFKMKVIDRERQVLINGAKEWTEERCGPKADAGVTNRKIIVDSYGGRGRHGGGGFNGKDPTKVDASAAAWARYEAKRMVAEDFANRVEIEVCYGIGQPRPFIVNIDTFGTAKKPERLFQERAEELETVSVDQIIEGLELFNQDRVKYRQAAVGGWYGRKEFPWEQV